MIHNDRRVVESEQHMRNIDLFNSRIRQLFKNRSEIIGNKACGASIFTGKCSGHRLYCVLFQECFEIGQRIAVFLQVSFIPNDLCSIPF